MSEDLETCRKYRYEFKPEKIRSQYKYKQQSFVICKYQF